MVSTIRAQIIAEIERRLQSAEWVTERDRTQGVRREEGPVVNVIKHHEEDRAAFTGTNAQSKDLYVDVVIDLRSDDCFLDDEEIDAIQHAAVLSEPTLGGLCGAIFRQSTEWQTADADANPRKVSVRYLVRYQTRANDLTRRAP